MSGIVSLYNTDVEALRDPQTLVTMTASELASARLPLPKGNKEVRVAITPNPSNFSSDAYSVEMWTTNDNRHVVSGNIIPVDPLRSVLYTGSLPPFAGERRLKRSSALTWQKASSAIFSSNPFLNTAINAPGQNYHRISGKFPLVRPIEPHWYSGMVENAAHVIEEVQKGSDYSLVLCEMDVDIVTDKNDAVWITASIGYPDGFLVFLYRAGPPMRDMAAGFVQRSLERKFVKLVNENGMAARQLLESMGEIARHLERL